MRGIILFTVLLGCAPRVYADPPALIRVNRNVASTDARDYADAKATVMVLGTMSVSGPSEPWFFEMHDSFASIEDLDKTLTIPRSGVPYSDEVLPPSLTLIALYRPNLSHRWDEADKNLAKARYFLISIYKIRPGAQAGFADLVRIRRSRFESINFDQPELAYQIMSGAPSGMFMFITPLASLKTFDDGVAKTPDGPREGGAAEQKLAAEVEMGHESFLFRIDPRASHVSDDFASGDPGFWNTKRRND
jgi:hypothetical protein